MVRTTSRLLPLAAAAALAACATANVAVNKGFDFSKIRRVAVVGFKDRAGRPGSGDVVTGAFEQSLLNAGYDVVERDQVARVMSELSLSGALDLRAARRLGQKLGVDALLMGQITDMAEPRSRLTKVDVVDDRVDPIYVQKTEREQNPDGSWSETRHQVISGYKTTHIVRREPREYTVSGRLGVAARLVYVGDARVVWSGSDSTETVSFEDSARALSDGILKAVKPTWPASAGR